jgi:hypothetical protein
MSLIGFLKTAAKIAVTGDSSYANRYELTSVFKGAVIELCRRHKFQAYYRKQFSKPEQFNKDTDISTERYAHLIVDLKRNERIISIGDVPFYSNFNGYTPTGFHQYKNEMLFQRLLNVDRYQDSFQVVDDILLQTKYMEKMQTEL